MSDYFEGRYIVFAHDVYYPQGGLSDVILDTDSMTEALAACAGSRGDVSYVYDQQERCVVEEDDAQKRP